MGFFPPKVMWKHLTFAVAVHRVDCFLTCPGGSRENGVGRMGKALNTILQKRKLMCRRQSLQAVGSQGRAPS